MNNAQHVLVTGGAGFIGSHLVERLLAEGASVVVIDDLSTGSLANLQAVAKHPKLRVVPSRISRCAELPKLVANASAIYHLAAAVGVELVVNSAVATLETNLRETEVLFKTLADHPTPVLLTSTSEVYGRSLKSEFRETDDLLIGPPNCARWSYACSKLMDEFLALAYAREQRLPVVVVRLFNTVGPRQTGRYGMVLPRFIEAAKRGEPLKVFGDGAQTRCFCYVSDVVEALIRLQNQPLAYGEVFNVGSTEEVTIRQLAERVVQVLGSGSRIELIPYSTAYGPGFEDMLRRKPCVEKIAAAVGFRAATSLEETIRRTAALAMV
ncbi:MAG: NAD-dependent epimerase/dehydratase family protein [Verrucomicrobiota bacterium]